MSQETVLAIDPGERVGWAVGESSPTELVVVKQGVSALKDFALKLHTSFGNYDTVAYEVWRLYPAAAKAMIGNDMQPSQLVGMIRLCAWLNPTVKLVSQGASIKNTALKTMPAEITDRFERSSEQHDKDALMHLWFYHWEKNVLKQQA